MRIGIIMKTQSIPLQEIISRIVAPDLAVAERSPNLFSGLGTMQSFNQRLANQPTLDFVNYNLRGIGQVIFVNNPLSGCLILLALFIQSPWMGLMTLLGVVSSTTTAIALNLDRDTIRNGIFGYNGALVGAAFATFGFSGNGNWNLSWAIAIIIFASLTTVMSKTIGFWWATTFKAPLLGAPFIVATLLFLSLVTFIPQPLFNLESTTVISSTHNSLDLFQIITFLPSNFGQVFLADKLLAGMLIVIAVAICTPLGLLIGLAGGMLGVIAGMIWGIVPEDLYAGLWGYNSILAAMAIGGIFYAPNLRSFLIGSCCGFFSAIVIPLLAMLTTPLGLPVLSLPFCIVTVACFVLLQRSIPSVVPVALHAVTSPEEHRQRYLIAQEIISNFRRQLKIAINGGSRNFLLDQATIATKGDLRYIFDAIDTDRSGELSTEELASYLLQADGITSEDELMYLFNCMDRDKSGTIDFQEFGELMLRHQRLSTKYEAFTTYFIPIDADENDLLSIEEMNIAMTSVGESKLTREEINFLQQRTNNQLFTWNQFIEILLLT